MTDFIFQISFAAEMLFDESDFEADLATVKEDVEEAPCPRSDCVAAREDLDRITAIRSGKRQQMITLIMINNGHREFVLVLVRH